MIGLIFILCFVLPFYFLPTIMAGHVKHSRIGLILLLNILLGWTVLGWFILMIYAAKKEVK